MTDLLERLRAANPVRTRNPPAIEDVWRELEHGAHGSNRDTSRRAGRGRDRVFSKVRLRASHVGLGLAVAVTALLAVLAIVLLGHGQTGSPASQTQPAHHKPAPSGADGSSSAIRSTRLRVSSAKRSATARPVANQAAQRAPTAPRRRATESVRPVP
jgi:hypothetical protein